MLPKNALTLPQPSEGKARFFKGPTEATYFGVEAASTASCLMAVSSKNFCSHYKIKNNTEDQYNSARFMLLSTSSASDGMDDSQP